MTDSERLNEVREMARYEGWSDPDPLGRNTVPVALAAFLLAEVERLHKQIELNEQSDYAKRLMLSKILWGDQEDSAVYPASWDNLYSAFYKRVIHPPSAPAGKER